MKRKVPGCTCEYNYTCGACLKFFGPTLEDKQPIGEVGFAKPGGIPLPILGPERVKLLQLARDGKPLPDGLQLIGDRAGGGFARIDREQVDWSGVP